MASFDPYHKWLGIPPAEQPADHYRLLGIPQFEPDLDVIEAAADRQSVFLRTFQSGSHGELAKELLNEVSAARICLLTLTEKAQYDQQLRRQLRPDLPPASPSKHVPPALKKAPAMVIPERSEPVVPSPLIRVEARQNRRAKPIWQLGGLPVVVIGLLVLATLVVIMRPWKESSRRVGDWQGTGDLQKLDDGAAKRSSDDEARMDTSQQETEQEDPPKEDPAKKEPLKKEPLKKEPPKKEPAKEDLPKKGPAKEDLPKKDAAKEGPPKPLPPEVEENLTAFYPFRGNAHNEVTAKHKGLIFSVEPATNRFEKRASAYGFNMPGAQIRIGNEPELSLGTFTISAWFKWNAEMAKAESVIINKGSGLNRDLTNYHLSIQKGKGNGLGQLQAKLGYAKVSPVVLTAKETIGSDQWYAVAFTYESAQQIAALYLDGELVDRKTDVRPPSDSSRFHAVMGNWSGSLDDIRIYKIALSQEQVKTLYDYEESTDPAVPDLATSDLTGTWKSTRTGSVFRVSDNGTTVEVSLQESEQLVDFRGVFQRQGVSLTSSLWECRFKELRNQMLLKGKSQGMITSKDTIRLTIPFFGEDNGELKVISKSTTWLRQR